MKSEYVSTEEAAELLNCSVRTVRYMIARGSIKAETIRVDPTVSKGVYRIPLSEIKRIQMLKKNTAVPA